VPLANLIFQDASLAVLSIGARSLSREPACDSAADGAVHRVKRASTSATPREPAQRQNRCRRIFVRKANSEARQVKEELIKTLPLASASIPSPFAHECVSSLAPRGISLRHQLRNRCHGTAGAPHPSAYPRDTDRDYSVSRFPRAHLLGPSLLLPPHSSDLSSWHWFFPSLLLLSRLFFLVLLSSHSSPPSISACTNTTKQEEEEEARFAASVNLLHRCLASSAFSRPFLMFDPPSFPAISLSFFSFSTFSFARALDG